MKKPTKTRAIFFPFDLFGSAGTAAGCDLLADALRELLADNRREEQPTRARAYEGQLKLREFSFATPDDYRDWRQQARRAIRQVLSKDEFLLWVSGNHLGVLPVYDELARGRPDTLVVQFDAHLDVYHLSDCTEELSHGNFLMHCDGTLPPVVNIGHRELILPDEHIGRFFKHTFAADEVSADTVAVVKSLRRLAKSAPAIFLDIDCDVFDVAYFPALAQSRPFGLAPATLLRLLDAVWSEKVIGLALSEFAPARDEHDHSLETLMWLVEYIVLRRYEMK